MVLALCRSCNVVNVSMKFHEDILNCLKVIERTLFCHRNYYLQSSKTLKIYEYIQELLFLCSARRLMLVNIFMKFHEDILNGLSYRADTILSLKLLFTKFKGA